MKFHGRILIQMDRIVSLSFCWGVGGVVRPIVVAVVVVVVVSGRLKVLLIIKPGVVVFAVFGLFSLWIL